MENYDLAKENKFIVYLDEKKFMWLGNKSISFFYKSKWLKNVDEFDVNSMRQNNLIGYIQ